MELVKVTVKNFLSIKEEETIKINNTITTIIGLNESGKTTLLKAIDKLNGSKIQKNEKNKSCKHENSYIIGKFLIKKEEIININNNSENIITLLPEKDIYINVFVDDEKETKSFYISERIDKKTVKEVDMNQIIMNNFINYLSKLSREYEFQQNAEMYEQSIEFADMSFEDLKKKLPLFAEKYTTEKLYDILMGLKNELTDSWESLIPEFRIIKFSSSTDLVNDEVSIDNFKNDIQVSNLLNIADIDLDELIQSFKTDDIESLATYEGDFKDIVTRCFKDIFRQNDKDFRFTIKIDTKNSKIMFFTKDKTTGNSPIPLKNRSDGFKWYFSIYITLYEYLQREDDKKYILLFDEPNLYLNPTAQFDLIERVFKNEFKHDQIIYTTHSPYMIDSTNFSSIRIVEKINQTKFYNTTVDYFKDHKTITKNEVDPLTPILTALNIDISNSLIMNKNKKIVVVEGIEDIYILNAMAKKTNNIKELKNVTFIPCFGASKVSTMFGYLYGLGYDVYSLLDNDSDGIKAIKEILGEEFDKSILYRKMMTYNLKLEETKDFLLENLFSEDIINQNLIPKSTILYRNFYDNIDKLELDKATINNFKSLYKYILNTTKGD